MKINQLSVLIGAALLATTAHAAEIYNKDGNKLDLYGLVSAEHYFSDNDSSDWNGDQTYMRLGFRGETQVNDQITGYGQWQMHINANGAESESNNPRTRYAFAGLKVKDYGSIDYGRNKGVLYDSLGYTDMQPEFDGMTYGSDQFMFSRANGLLTYRNTDFFGAVDGLDFALQYQGKNDGGGEPGVRDVLRQNGDGFGASITYDIGAGFSIAGSMMSADRSNEQNNTSGIMGQVNVRKLIPAQLNMMPIISIWPLCLPRHITHHALVLIPAIAPMVMRINRKSWNFTRVINLISVCNHLWRMMS
jgi:outer membrane pore protein C